MFPLFISLSIIYNIAHFCLILSLIVGFVAYILSHKVSKNTKKFKFLHCLTLVALLFGIMSTIAIWITSNKMSEITDAQIVTLQKESNESDSLKNLLELELDSVKSSLIETEAKAELVSKKFKQSQKIINTRVIDPIRMAEMLSEKRDVKIALASISDIEAQSLFNDLAKAFKLANWQIISSMPNTSVAIITNEGVTTPQGITIEASSDELAQFLKTAFEYFDISCSIRILNRLPANQLDVLIGAR